MTGRQGQLDLLCERAAGLFVYAVATVKFIDHKNNNPKKQLDRLLQSPESSARSRGRPSSRRTRPWIRSTRQFSRRLSVQTTQRMIPRSVLSSVL
jgi:hypothetical protein